MAKGGNLLLTAGHNMWLAFAEPYDLAACGNATHNHREQGWSEVYLRRPLHQM